MKIALISDIHEDIVALELALQKISDLKCDEVICLGDISGFSVPYYPYLIERNASACLQLIREKCSSILVGNHDLSAIRKTPEISPEFEYPENWYELDYAERKEKAWDKLWLYDHDELNPLYGKSDKAFLDTLPEFCTKQFGEVKVFLSHYAYPNLTGSYKDFYLYKADLKRHFDFMNQHNCEISFVGHAHAVGLFVGTESDMLKVDYNQPYQINGKCCIHLPAACRKREDYGFAVFDTEKLEVVAFQI